MAQTALVTGASGGIGEAIARELAKRGYHLVLAGRQKERLELVAESLPNATIRICDLSLATDIASLISESPQVDILVNNAGFATYGDFAETPLAEQLDMIQVNVSALTQLTHSFLPSMLDRKSGKVMNVASTAAFVPGPLMAVYFATKAYVLSLTEALAEEYKNSGVSFTCLCPGPTQSGFQERAKMAESRLASQPLVTSEFVAERGVADLLAGKVLSIPSRTDQIKLWSLRLAPRSLVAENVGKAIDRVRR
ncbi:MAG: SDR family oxidoreductase [Fimbriimonadaceae bacterium]|nr:SDR family oxidoreductase [Fimbriimonadaceae bacterium]